LADFLAVLKNGACEGEDEQEQGEGAQ